MKKMFCFVTVFGAPALVLWITLINERFFLLLYQISSKAYDFCESDSPIPRNLNFKFSTLFFREAQEFVWKKTDFLFAKNHQTLIRHIYETLDKSITPLHTYVLIQYHTIATQLLAPIQLIKSISFNINFSYFIIHLIRSLIQHNPIKINQRWYAFVIKLSECKFLHFHKINQKYSR